MSQCIPLLQFVKFYHNNISVLLTLLVQGCAVNKGQMYKEIVIKNYAIARERFPVLK